MAAKDTTISTRLGPYFLSLWLVALPFSTAAAEILLGLTVVAAFVALRTGGVAGPDRRGWMSLLTGGPSTRLVPWLFAALVLCITLSIFFGVDRDGNAKQTLKLFRYALFFCPLAFSWRAGDWRRTYLLLMLMTLVLAVLTARPVLAGYSRPGTPTLHYNTLAQVAALLSLFFASGFLYGPSAGGWWRRAFVFFALLGAAILVVTHSRAALGGWLSGLVLLAVFRLSPKTLIWLAVGFSIVLGVGFGALQSRRSDAVDIQDSEFTRRYDMWRMARDIVVDHPLVGVGPGGMEVVYDEYRIGVLIDDSNRWIHVHNDVFEIALRHGVIAALIWVALIVNLYVAGVRRLLGFRHTVGKWHKAAFAGCAASLHCFFVCGLLHDNFVIYVKICLMLFLWGQLVSLDRRLSTPKSAFTGGGAV